MANNWEPFQMMWLRVSAVRGSIIVGKRNVNCSGRMNSGVLSYQHYSKTVHANKNNTNNGGYRYCC